MRKGMERRGEKEKRVGRNVVRKIREEAEAESRERGNRKREGK